jgi:hypothetical protein
MNQYRIYEFNDQNHIEKRHDLAAPDDVAAVQQAKLFADKSVIEVWQSGRFIARVGRDGEPVP